MLHATPFFITVASRSVNALGYEKNGTAAPYDTWERFVAEKSRELARKTLLVTARHRQRLARKQILMKRFVKASMNLLAIEAAVWYASQPDIKQQNLSQCLLEHFCSQLREEFDPMPLLCLHTASCNDDMTVYRLAREILTGRADWLEEGIIKVLPA